MIAVAPASAYSFPTFLLLNSVQEITRRARPPIERASDFFDALSV